MQRITLSDGTVLQKGVRLMVASRFRDPETYPDPNTFVATRFLDPLNKGSPNSTKHYVTTSAEMFAFGKTYLGLCLIRKTRKQMGLKGWHIFVSTTNTLS